MAEIDGVGHLLPVLLAEVAAVEIEIAAAPSVDESGCCFFAPAVFAER